MSTILDVSFSHKNPNTYNLKHFVNLEITTSGDVIFKLNILNHCLTYTSISKSTYKDDFHIDGCTEIRLRTVNNLLDLYLRVGYKYKIWWVDFFNN